jgi:hypothetical protein
MQIPEDEMPVYIILAVMLALVVVGFGVFIGALSHAV